MKQVQIFRVDQIQKPLLIFQGAKDKRVPKEGVDKFVAALRKAKKELKYKVFPEESHHIRYWKNQFRLYQDIEIFLAKYLGGRKVSFDAL